MTVLENVTSGITLMSSTLTSVIGTFSAEPLVYFVGAAFGLIAFAAIRKTMMPRKKS